MEFGERALEEVTHLLTTSWSLRDKLREAGWTRVLHPPLVNNEWIWEHPLFGCKTQSEAVKWLG